MKIQQLQWVAGFCTNKHTDFQHGLLSPVGAGGGRGEGGP